jgi:uncharacterized membrane protein
MQQWRLLARQGWRKGQVPLLVLGLMLLTLLLGSVTFTRKMPIVHTVTEDQFPYSLYTSNLVANTGYHLAQPLTVLPDKSERSSPVLMAPHNVTHAAGKSTVHALLSDSKRPLLPSTSVASAHNVLGQTDGMALVIPMQTTDWTQVRQHLPLRNAVGVSLEGRRSASPALVLKLSPTATRKEKAVVARKATSPATRPKGSGQQRDVYGVIMDVKTVGPISPGSLSRADEKKEILQKVTVRLDLNTRVPGLAQDTIVVDNILGENPAYNIPLKPGSRVLLTLERHPGGGKDSFFLSDRNRTPAILILGTLMVLAMLLIGGPEVAKHALLGLVMLVGCYQALFPAIQSGTVGFNWIVLMCFMFTILASFIYQVPGTRSFSREQSVVVLGTFGGLLILTSLLCVMHEITPLDGYSSEGLASLWYSYPHLDYWLLYVASVLIGFQGFLFYLCWMLSQQRRDSESLTFRAHFWMVMHRGRRLLGPMTSSLGLLFLGLFLPILLQMQGTPRAQFINLESTDSMICFAFAGALTLILTVPLVALIAAWRLSAPKQTEMF